MYLCNVLVDAVWICSWDPNFGDYVFSMTMEGLDFGEGVPGSFQVSKFE